MKSLYELPSVDDDAEALKKVFRKAVNAQHPDLHPTMRMPRRGSGKLSPPMPSCALRAAARA
jgi:hypothetical protein